MHGSLFKLSLKLFSFLITTTTTQVAGKNVIGVTHHYAVSLLTSQPQECDVTFLVYRRIIHEEEDDDYDDEDEEEEDENDDEFDDDNDDSESYEEEGDEEEGENSPLLVRDQIPVILQKRIFASNDPTTTTVTSNVLPQCGDKKTGSTHMGTQTCFQTHTTPHDTLTLYKRDVNVKVGCCFFIASY